MANKKKRTKSKVYCFVGDMTSETGVFHECLKYAQNFKLPIHFIIENNKISVCTDTFKTWGQKKSSYYKSNNKFITYYEYKSKYPHSGAGVRIDF